MIGGQALRAWQQRPFGPGSGRPFGPAAGPSGLVCFFYNQAPWGLNFLLRLGFLVWDLEGLLLFEVFVEV